MTSITNASFTILHAEQFDILCKPITPGWLLNQLTHINPGLKPINLVLRRFYVLPLPNLHPFLHLKELEGLHQILQLLIHTCRSRPTATSCTFRRLVDPSQPSHSPWHGHESQPSSCIPDSNRYYGSTSGNHLLLRVNRELEGGWNFAWARVT